MSQLNIIQLPVTSTISAYSFKTTLDGQIYTLAFHYETRLGNWIMDIYDSTGAILLKAGIPMQTGYPLNWRYAQRLAGMPPGLFFVNDDSGQGQSANTTNFGVTVNLYYIQAGA